MFKDCALVFKNLVLYSRDMPLGKRFKKECFSAERSVFRILMFVQKCNKIFATECYSRSLYIQFNINDESF